MDTTEQRVIVEAFLLIEQPRQRLGHWTKSLAPLDEAGAPPTIAIIAYYDPTCDQALIDLQYEVTNANMQFVIDVAVLAEVGMVQPAELSEGERMRFLADRLTRCTIRVTGQTSAASALVELVRKIKDTRVSPPRLATQPPPVPAAALARSMQPRGDTHDPVMLVNAKGTRDDLERLRNPLGDGPEPPPPPRPGTALAEPPPPPQREATVNERPGAQLDAEQARARDHFRNFDRHRTVEMPAEMSQRLIGESSEVLNLDDFRPTTEMVPLDRKRLLEDIQPPAPPPPVLPPHVHKTPPAPRSEKPTVRATPHRLEPLAEPYLPPSPTDAVLPHVIYARYLRSGRWIPVRVGALSLKGAALLAGALPRVDDHVDVALAFGSYRALVRGKVLKISTMREATMTGASTFSVAFDLDDSSRRQLTNLLTAARDARITIKPPPARATRRFPVEWQVALGTVRGAVKALALDVSTQGMFVQPAVTLDVGSTLTFSVMLDDGAAPIAGRARVVRQILEDEARVCGLLPGYGLLLVNMSEADRMRWLGFLARIERRADKRVLIGAAPSRLAELQAGLASLGYAVTGGTDPGALVELANSDARPADAVLIDAGWLQNEASASLVENLFTARNVPCVTMQGEVRRARQAIDKLLDVVV
jgi:hypothetical protein